jgi:hypothetical protein
MVQLTFEKAAGRILVSLSATRIGSDDLLIVITGGKAHVGAVAAGTNSGGLPSSSVITLPGHRDDRIAKDVAERVSKRLGCNCAVIAGVHYDDMTAQEIKDVLIMCSSLMDEMEGAIRT